MTAGIGAIGGVGGAGVGGIAGIGPAGMGGAGGLTSAPTMTPSSPAGATAPSSHVSLSQTALGLRGAEPPAKSFSVGPAGSYERVAALGAPSDAMRASSYGSGVELGQLVGTSAPAAVGTPLDPLGRMIDSLTDTLIMMLIIRMMETVRKAAEPESSKLSI